MSKLDIIMNSLQNNPSVKIVNVYEQGFSLKSAWNMTTDIYTAPVSGGIFDPKELQDFMMSLVPKDLEPTCKDDFHPLKKVSNYDLRFGKLYFDEVIGTLITELETQDIELLKELSGKTTLEQIELKRRTWVRVYPCEEYVLDLLAGKFVHGEYNASWKTIDGYKPNEYRGLARVLHEDGNKLLPLSF